MQRLDELPWETLRERICGIWYCDNLEIEPLTPQQKELIHFDVVIKMQKKVEAGIQTFSIPFFEKISTVPLETGHMLLRQLVYFCFLGVLPYDAFVRDRPKEERRLWKAAYNGFDVCLSMGKARCHDHDERYARCAEGLLKTCSHLIVAYGESPNQRTLDLIAEAQKDGSRTIDIISYASSKKQAL